MHIQHSHTCAHTLHTYNTHTTHTIAQHTLQLVRASPNRYMKFETSDGLFGEEICTNAHHVCTTGVLRGQSIYPTEAETRIQWEIHFHLFWIFFSSREPSSGGE